MYEPPARKSLYSMVSSLHLIMGVGFPLYSNDISSFARRQMEKHIANAHRERFLNKSAQWKQTLTTRKVSLAGSFHTQVLSAELSNH